MKRKNVPIHLIMTVLASREEPCPLCRMCCAVYDIFSIFCHNSLKADIGLVKHFLINNFDKRMHWLSFLQLCEISKKRMTCCKVFEDLEING